MQHTYRGEHAATPRPSGDRAGRCNAAHFRHCGREGSPERVIASAGFSWRQSISSARRDSGGGWQIGRQAQPRAEAMTHFHRDARRPSRLKSDESEFARRCGARAVFYHQPPSTNHSRRISPMERIVRCRPAGRPYDDFAKKEMAAQLHDQLSRYADWPLSMANEVVTPMPLVATCGWCGQAAMCCVCAISQRRAKPALRGT